MKALIIKALFILDQSNIKSWASLTYLFQLGIVSKGPDCLLPLPDATLMINKTFLRGKGEITDGDCLLLQSGFNDIGKISLD